MPVSTIPLASAVSGTLPDGSAPSGSVIQVVTDIYSGQVSTNGNTFTDTGLNASITPTSASSKILVIVHQSGQQKGGDTTVGLQLVRNSTSILLFDRGGDTGNGDTINFGGSGCCYLDSPATTSSVNYKTQFRSSLAGATVYVQAGSTTSISTITLMEIAA